MLIIDNFLEKKTQRDAHLLDKEIKTDLKMPDELKQLKNRLRLELDSDITDRVIDEWYEEYHEKLIVQSMIVNANDGLESKDVEHWRNWALQNVS